MHHPLVPKLAYAHASYIPAVYGNITRTALTKAGYHIYNGTLTVALNATYAYDLSLAYRKGYTTECLFACLVVGDQILNT